MADIELVIKIPKEMYQAIKGSSMYISGRRNGKTIGYTLFNAVKNGITLPKGHGKIGDLDALREEVSSWGMNDYEPSDFIDAIDQADTIIEADKSENEVNK